MTKQTISDNQTKFLAILRDRQSQKIAVAAVATASTLIFSIMNLQNPNNRSIREATVETYKSATIAAPKQDSIKKDVVVEEKKSVSSETKNVPVVTQTPTATVSTIPQSQPRTANETAVVSNTDNQSSSEVVHVEVVKPEETVKTTTVSKPKESIVSTKPRINANAMQTDSKPNNWSGDRYADETKIESEWNNEDEIEEIKVR